MKKRNKAYKPKLIKIPMTKALYDEFGIQMHSAYAAMSNYPCLEAFNALAHIMNVVTQAARNDTRFEHEMLYLNTGIATMNQVYGKCEARRPLKDYETAAIGVAVSAIDRVLPYMDVSKLYVAMNEVRVQQCLPQ